MSKFTNDINQLIDYIGGKDNIVNVSHCATRLRFVLNDPKRADIEKIEGIKSVKGSFTQAGQFQVIIGNEVSTFYNELIQIADIEVATKEDTKVAGRQNLNPLQRLVSHLAEIFAPIIPAIVVGGLILGFRNIIGDIKMLEGGTKTLIEVSQFWAGVHHFLWLIGEAIFHFLPVGITWSIAKKSGTTQILGIVLGITLVSPQLLNAYGVAGGAEIPVWDFGFAQVQMIGYQA
jgi:PTS system trehalose-specific IIC component